MAAEQRTDHAGGDVVLPLAQPLLPIDDWNPFNC
jgi:hypothetical protein